jgi:phosphatidylserine/phosphatidylglycerophosphate/cardiolipin synthase-like enzyme/uncharacterized membrane protein YdjX (TVP38/TMEM64 family)
VTDDPSVPDAWRVERARRFALLVDGEHYFTALYRALCAARHTIYVLGWDIDSRAELMPGGGGRGSPTSLGELLERLVRERRDLRVYVLTWDWAPIYALERDPLTRARLGWTTPRRLHFRYDGKHPLRASHHQMVVVVDDEVAFSGGLDLTGHRWDTFAHAVDDARRTTPLGKRYDPFHDVQCAVDGDAAAALGELCRERWRASGRPRRIASPPARGAGGAGAGPPGVWPAELEPDLRDVDVAIARTLPAFGRRAAVHEVRSSYLRAIEGARDALYFENQYFTSPEIAAALAARLAQPDGPEVVMVLPRSCSGWLEQHTMGALRSEVLATLRAADRHGRLRLWRPVASLASQLDVFVHAKVMVVDDRELRVGSANLSRRSLGLDTECDLTVLAATDEQRRGVALLRARLVSEHLGLEPERFERTRTETGSLIAAIERHLGGDRTLVALDEREEAAPEPLLSRDAVDPDGPLSVTRLVDRIASSGRRRTRNLPPAGWIAAATVAALVLALRFTPLADVLDAERLQSLASSLRGSSLAPFAVVGAFVLASLVVFPLQPLILGTVIVFGPLVGTLLALAGVLAGSSSAYALGRWLGAEPLTRLAGSRLGRLRARLAASGVVGVAIVRLVPVAPASVVSMLCGAAGVRFAPFTLGTLIGFLPGTLAMALLGERAAAALENPSPFNLLATAAIAVALLGLVLIVQRRLELRRRAVERRSAGG